MRYRNLLCLTLFVGISLAQAATSVRLGVIVPLSGGSKSIGEDIRNGAQQALETLRPELTLRGLRVSLYSQDDASSAEGGTQAAQNMVKLKTVMAVVGPLNTASCQPASEVLAKANLGMVTTGCASTAFTTRNLANVNRLVASNRALAVSGADYLLRTVGVKTVLLIEDSTPFARDLNDNLQARFVQGGGAIIERFVLPGRDLDAAVQRILALKPESVHLSLSSYEDSSAIIKRARRGNFSGLFLGTVLLNDPSFINLSGRDAEGITYTSYIAPLAAYSRAVNFGTIFRKRFGSTPSAFALLGFDAALTALEAMMRTWDSQKELTRAAVQSELRLSDLKNTLTGDVAFDPKGNRTSSSAFVIRIGPDLLPRVVQGFQVRAQDN